MATMYTPLTDDMPGRAATFNAAFQELENAITARAGVMVKMVGWTTLAADAPYISIDVASGYRELTLMAGLRANLAGTYEGVRIAINDEFTSNYRTRIYLNGGFSDHTTVNGWLLPVASAVSDASAGSYGYLKLQIAGASSPVTKLAQSDSVVPHVAGVDLYYSWGSASTSITSTITRIRITPTSATAFLAGSGYALYGMS